MSDQNQLEQVVSAKAAELLDIIWYASPEAGELAAEIVGNFIDAIDTARQQRSSAIAELTELQDAILNGDIVVSDALFNLMVRVQGIAWERGYSSGYKAGVEVGVGQSEFLKWGGKN